MKTLKPPRKTLSIKNDLDRLIANLLEIGICDDTNFSTIRAVGRQWEVTFLGAQYISIAFSDIDYSDIYLELSDNRSYNVKFIDGALLQFMYRFEGNRLVQHRLAFYPSPSLRPFQEDPEAYMKDELFLEIVQRRIIPFPLRCDFDDRPGVHIDIVHPKSHLTLGDVKGCRIPITSPITPRWFVEFILRNFYHTDKYDFISTLPKHQFQFDISITVNERNLIHLAVPTSMISI